MTLTRQQARVPDTTEPFGLGWLDWFAPDRFFPRRFYHEFVKPVESMIRVEEFVQDGYFVVRAELPGVDPDKDVEIFLREGTLEIRAERKEAANGKAGHRSEFRYGSFERVIPLPTGVAEKDIKASYLDGILEIRVPTADTQTVATKIPVTHAAA
jgi:HSP20 family protein